MNGVFIVKYRRTPVGKYGGMLSHIRPDDLGAIVIAEVQKQSGVPAQDIDEVIVGCANQAGEDNRNVARFAALLAGLPVSVPAYTVNRLCASGMQSVIDAWALIRTSAAHVVIAGGVESMSRAPYVVSKAVKAFERGIEMHDTTLGWRFINERFRQHYYPYTMGETGENIAERWGISREQQDAWALRSHRRYMDAWTSGHFAHELISIPDIMQRDEGVRTDTSMDKLASLNAVFRKDGSLTAGNSSGINDGASAMLMASEDAVNRLQLQPLARIVAVASAGVYPDVMGTGPIPAIKKLLQQTGLTINDIDFFEINEAYAVQVICCMQELGIPAERLNVNGGAIAIGHPLGMSGNRITGHLAHELHRTGSRYGIAAMCVGVGQGTAILIENVTKQ